jgi:hypothetical protein
MWTSEEKKVAEEKKMAKAKMSKIVRKPYIGADVKLLKAAFKGENARTEDRETNEEIGRLVEAEGFGARYGLGHQR